MLVDMAKRTGTLKRMAISSIPGRLRVVLPVLLILCGLYGINAGAARLRANVKL